MVDPLRDESADIAREAGVLVSFDLNYRAALWSADDAGEVFRSLIAQADIVFAGDDEAAIAVGPSEDSLELARRVAAPGPSQAVIKRGAAGCAAVIDGVEYGQDAVRVNALDTVGADDAFVAGYLSDLLAGCLGAGTAAHRGPYGRLRLPGAGRLGRHAAPPRACLARRHGTGGSLTPPHFVGRGLDRRGASDPGPFKSWRQAAAELRLRFLEQCHE